MVTGHRRHNPLTSARQDLRQLTNPHTKKKKKKKKEREKRRRKGSKEMATTNPCAKCKIWTNVNRPKHLVNN